MKTIPLTQGQFAIVDDADYEELSQFKWYAHKSRNTYYARRNTPRPHQKIVKMHRVVSRATEGAIVDHINGNGLDNRRSNLRLCTAAENGLGKRRANLTSRFKGVHFYARTKKWMAQIQCGGIHYHLGTFTSEETAALAYDNAAVRLHGQFARLNFK